MLRSQAPLQLRSATFKSCIKDVDTCLGGEAGETGGGVNEEGSLFVFGSCDTYWRVVR